MVQLEDLNLWLLVLVFVVFVLALVVLVLVLAGDFFILSASQ